MQKNKGKRLIYPKIIEDAVACECIKATYMLPHALTGRIEGAFRASSGIEKKVLGRILENNMTAARNRIPACQDTGIFEIWIM